jgi:peptidoglycan/LPS O-acetylase OafA/YrhL
MPDRGHVTVKRSGALDLFRIIFALMVLWGHSYEMIDGDAHREIFTKLHLDMSWGSIGVDGFFLLSGFLIVQSWMRDSRLSDFLRKRVLRIVPGYVVAVVLSFIAAGIFAPGAPRFFHDSLHSVRFWISTLLLDAPLAAPAFPGNSNNAFNGSLWTITYEFRCYLLVALFGIAGFIRQRFVWLAITGLFFLIMTSLSIQQHISWTHSLLITGNPVAIFRLLPVFLLGGCYALFRAEIKFRPLFALLALIAVVSLPYLTGRMEPWMVLFGGYLLMYLASLPLQVFHWWHGMPDVSYGTYLYGWPVQSFVIWLYHPPFLVIFSSTAVICLILGWLSWHFVERPMLRLKPGRQVELPAA